MWMLQWFGQDKKVWTTRPVVSSHSWYPYSIINKKWCVLNLCIIPYFFWCLSLSFPFCLCLSLSLSLFMALSPSVSLSLTLSLSPHRVCSGRLPLTCSPVHPQICCSDQLSSLLKPGPETPRLWTEKANKQTFSSREGKRTHKPKNTRIKCPL